MKDEDNRRRLLEKLKDAVVRMDPDSAREAALEAVEFGLDPVDALMNGLVPGMQIVGELFEKGEYFVPEVLLASEAFYAAMDILKPHIRKEDIGIKGVCVIGVVEGDIHDLGKNLVKTMLEAAGFEVIDLGKDVPIERFVEETLRSDADIVAISAMMTTTMVKMKDIVDLIRRRAPRAKILVGGAPVTEDFAKRIGANGWAPNATNAVREAIRLISAVREEVLAARERRRSEAGERKEDGEKG